MKLNYQQALQKLSLIGQQHLLAYCDCLTPPQQDVLLAQIEHLDIGTFQEQRRLITLSNPGKYSSLEPFSTFALSGNLHDAREGKNLLAQGSVGCLIVAGGQGTRLNFAGPKGMFPISVVRHKSLFQIFAEKTLAASRLAQKDLPLAIMTSPANQAETEAFFKSHDFFGLKPGQLAFFSQSTLPLLDHNGDLFLEAPDTLAAGPDGNGFALHLFYQSGIWKQWYSQGVRYLNFAVIDNPLADPFDAELLGFLHRTDSTVTVKCISRNNAIEKVGVLAKLDSKTIVVEYSEMPKALSETLKDGSLRFPCANISLFCFGMEFVKQLVESAAPMPMHAAFKAANYLSETRTTHQTDQPFAWKFEKFIFDVLPHAPKVSVLLYPREVCFSPLKNFAGEYSISNVQFDLQKNDQRVFSEISGHPCDTIPFEIAQEFYYPSSQLRAKWRDCHPPKAGYLEA